MSRAVVTAATALTAGLAAWSFYSVSLEVPEPYLDEVFHIPQTVQYCHGDFKTWDNKITTPPGLYWLAVAYIRVASNLVPEAAACDVNWLRSVNLLGDLVVIPLSVLMLPRDVIGSRSSFVAISLFPLLFFFTNLFYTDVWATAAVLLCAALGFRDLPMTAAIVGLYSLTLRQTNVVWVAFVAFACLLRRLDAKQLTDVPRFVRQVVTNAGRSWGICLPFGLVGVAFAAFVKSNGGITLGDKSNHQVGLNVPQLFYFVLFLLFFSWPLWLHPHLLKRYFVSCVGSPVKIFFYLGSLAAIVLAIDRLTIVHPFILADNRHYTFYLWRRLIHPTQANFQFLLVPVYHFGLWVVMTPAWTVSPLLAVAYAGSALATLVPSPLFEPRYYIVPYVLWRLLFVGKRGVPAARLAAECAWYLCVNSATIYIFIARPFAWPSEPGRLQRFMW